MTSLLIVLLILFTLLSGFFSGSETALFSLSPMQVRANRGKPVGKLLEQPRQLLVTILMLNVLVNILVQNVAASLFGAFANWGLKVGVPLALTLFFGELIPKSIALPNNTSIAKLVAPPIGFLHRILGPIRRFITRLTSLISKVMFFFLRRSKAISRDEVEHALETSTEKGLLVKEEAILIHGYLAFQEVTVKEIMRPRDELLIYDRKEPIEALMHLFRDKQCSRVPVCEGSVENIVGVIEASDFFLHRDKMLQHLTLDKPYFVPESMPARVLLRQFQERGREMAVVVDEYGSVAGLVTREDIVETVVGEIVDKRDEAIRYTRASEDVIIASGKLELSELNELFDTAVESEENLVTVGGYLTEKLGSLPKAGDKVQTDDFLFHVLAAEPNRVRRVYIRRRHQ